MSRGSARTISTTPPRAEAVYRQVLQLAPDDASIALPACRALERIYSRGDSQQLREILRIEVRLEDEQRRASRAARAARRAVRDGARRPARGDRGLARAARGRPERRARALGARPPLRADAELARARRGACACASARATTATRAGRCMVRIARTLADKLTDVPAAILAYRAVIDDFGADRASLGAARGALRAGRPLAGPGRHARVRPRAGRDSGATSSPSWRASARSGRSSSGDVASAPSRRTGRRWRSIRRTRAAAARSRRCWSDDDGAPRGGRDPPPALRGRRPAREAPAGPRDRGRARGLDLGEARHHRPGGEGRRGPACRRAAGARRTRRAGCARPSRIRSCRQWIERVERLAAATGKHAELVELLRAAVGDIVDGDLQLEVTLRIAEIARSPLGETALAKEYYAKALDLRGDDRRALVALESLYEETGDHAALARRGQAAGRRRGLRCRSASSSSSSRPRSATRSSATRAAAIARLRADPRDGARREGHRRARAPLRPGRALARPDRALRAADRGARIVQRAQGGAASRPRHGPREADRRRRARVRRVRRGARDRSEAPAVGGIPRGADGPARARGARRRDARAGVPGAPRLEARHDHARGSPRRQPGPGRAPPAPATALQAARGAGRGLQGRARDDRAPPHGGPDRRGHVGRARAARARRQRRGAARGRLRGRAREDPVGRAGDRPAREAHRGALRGAEERRPRPSLLPPRLRLRPGGQERQLRGDRSPAARDRAGRPIGSSSTATRSSSSTTPSSASGRSTPSRSCRRRSCRTTPGRSTRTAPRSTSTRAISTPSRRSRASTRAASGGATSRTSRGGAPSRARCPRTRRASAWSSRSSWSGGSARRRPASTSCRPSWSSRPS